MTGSGICGFISGAGTAVRTGNCRPARYPGFAITATKITIIIPAIRARLSPEFTYNTGYRCYKKTCPGPDFPPDNENPEGIPDYRPVPDFPKMPEKFSNFKKKPHNSLGISDRFFKM